MITHGMSKRKLSLLGNYKLTGRVLGKGNFARVEEAYHELLGIKVAVKVMDLNIIKEEYVLKNLCREAKIMSKLKHPCIVTLFETMRKSDNIYYLITEIVTGGDLCTYVKSQRNGKLEEKTAKYFTQQFVSAMGYMHQKGIVHRDLKMENVMLNSSQNLIKIVDFGLSNEWSPDSPLKTHCGSPEYAAPELFIVSKVYGPEVDLWSLGIILYGMVIGQLPFVSNRNPSISSQERRKILVAQINKGIAAPQRKAIAGFSIEFRNLISLLLNADPKKRITIKEMIVHPWITESGKKKIRTNPLKKVTSETHDKMIYEITILCGITKNEVSRLVEKNPLGPVGAMYNMLLYRSLTKPFTADLITRIVSEITTAKTPKKVSKYRKELPRILLQNPKLQEDKVKERISRPNTTSTCNLNELGTVLSKKTPNLFPIIAKNMKEDSSKKENPRPRSFQLSKKNDVRDVRRPATSALQKRQEYSASLASRGIQNIFKFKKCATDKNTDIKENFESSRKCELLVFNKAAKLFDTNTPKKKPGTPLIRGRTFKDRLNNEECSRELQKQKNIHSTAAADLTHIYTLMRMIAPNTTLQKKETNYVNSGAKSGSNKILMSKKSGIPIMPRSTPARTKLSDSHPRHTTFSNEKDIRRLRYENK